MENLEQNNPKLNGQNQFDENNSIAESNINSMDIKNSIQVVNESAEIITVETLEDTQSTESVIDSTKSESLSNENLNSDNGENQQKSTAADALLKRIAKKKGIVTDDIEKEPVITETDIKNDNLQIDAAAVIVEKEAVIEEVVKLDAPEKIVPISKIEEIPLDLDIVVTEEHLPIEDLESEEIIIPEDALVDYSSFSKEELVNACKEVLAAKKITEIKNEIESIRANFYKKHNAEISELKKKFIENGNLADEFQAPVEVLEEEMKELYKKYKDHKNQHNEQIEVQKGENLKIKYQIIEDLKELVKGNESLNKTFQDFRDLQKRWREIGLVPQSEVKTLWETYHHHVENFYDFINLNKELRDLDLKKNLESKMALCEKAEELLLETSILKAFRTLQKYHAQWREIGPVPREKKDEIWERFKTATAKINKSYQEHIQKIKDEQENNLKAKVMLCEKAEELAELNPSAHKDWEDSSKEIIDLQKLWRLIGFAPKKDNNIIYERFRTACDKFFNLKREFYNQSKEEQNNNLQLKTELCMQAESLKDSTDWKKTTEIFINIQKKWKEIGPVPRKNSDALWKRFRAACNYFFDIKAKHFASLDAEQDENLKLKNQLIEEILNFQFGENHDDNLTKLKEYQKKWTDIGHVPFKDKDEIVKRYREAINAKFDTIKFDDEKRNDIRFKSRLENLKQSPKANTKIRFEREKIANKLKEVENDIVLWENNIGFFAKSKNAESLIDDVKNKIDKARKLAESLREKLRVMDDMVNGEEN